MAKQSRKLDGRDARWRRPETRDPILAHAAAIVRSYTDTGVTLRQLFYRLVADQTLRNTHVEYQALSSYTAQARRAGTFPQLIDRTRAIKRYPTFVDPGSAREWLRAIYRRDRSENQDVRVYIGVEKAGLVEQLMSWFHEPYGIPILPLGGNASQSFNDEVVEDVRSDKRPAVLLYGGDFDPSGESIERVFVKRTDCWAKVVRVVLTEQQVRDHQLPINAGKALDPNAPPFIEKYGALMQVEMDALPPNLLRQLFQEVIDPYLDMSKLKTILRREKRDQRKLSQQEDG